MAKVRMRCVFSDKACRDCPLFRGRHYYLCYARSYRGLLAAPPEEKTPARDGEPWYESLFPPEAPVEAGLDALRDVADDLDLSFTPDDYAEERYDALAGRPPRREHGRYFLQIDVWGCKAKLCLVDTADRGSSVPLSLAIPERMLEDAVFSTGGALLLAGHYPVDDAVRTWVREALARP